MWTHGRGVRVPIRTISEKLLRRNCGLVSSGFPVGFCALRSVQCGVFLLPKFDRKVQFPPARKYCQFDILSPIRAMAGVEGSCPTFLANNKKSGTYNAVRCVGGMKVEEVGLQGMRGSALRASGKSVSPCDPRGLAGAIQPRAPRSKGALLPCEIPAPELPCSGTNGQSVRPFGNRAQGALLPETPTSKECSAPFRPYPSLRRRVLQ